jgi:hypothetical protein
MANGDGAFSVFHGIWEAILTAFGGLLLWLLSRFSSQLDTKADKDAVRDRFDQMQAVINRMLDTQERHHSDNIERMDKLIERLHKE